MMILALLFIYYLFITFLVLMGVVWYGREGGGIQI